MRPFAFLLGNVELVGKAGDPGPLRFRGVAATGDIDTQGERIGKVALDLFKSSGVGRPLCAAGSHKEAMVNPLVVVGKIDECGGEDGEFGIAGEFDDTHPYYGTLCKAFTNDTWPAGLKLSVGGELLKRHNEWSGGKMVSIIDEMTLDHVLLCRADAAINQGTSIGADGKCATLAEVVFKANSDWPDDDAAKENDLELPPSPSDEGKAQEGGPVSNPVKAAMDALKGVMETLNSATEPSVERSFEDIGKACAKKERMDVEKAEGVPTFAQYIGDDVEGATPVEMMDHSWGAFQGCVSDIMGDESVVGKADACAAAFDDLKSYGMSKLGLETVAKAEGVEDITPVVDDAPVDDDVVAEDVAAEDDVTGKATSVVEDEQFDGNAFQKVSEDTLAAFGKAQDAKLDAIRVEIAEVKTQADAVGKAAAPLLAGLGKAGTKQVQPEVGEPKPASESIFEDEGKVVEAIRPNPLLWGDE